MAEYRECPYVQIHDGMSDDEYFEALSGEVFQVIIGAKPVVARWRYIKRAFADFSVEKVAKFNDVDVERLMADASIVRNRKKIWATIENARTFLEIKRDHGSFDAYIKSFRGNTERLVADLDKRIRYIGALSIRRFLGCVTQRAA